jgi:hypothetical protein
MSIAQGFAEASLKRFFQMVDSVDQVEAVLAQHFDGWAA